MLCIPKEDSDIQMVYHGMSSGITDCLFFPYFGLLAIRDVTRTLVTGYHKADMDVGEMFPDFILGEELQACSGVDVTHVKTCELDLTHHHHPYGLLRISRVGG